jgi:PAS domain S-box-containing protein
VVKLASPPEVRSTDTLVRAATALPAIDAVDDLARFARAVSHDFSSPLLAIRCFATLLIDGLSGIIDDEKSGYLSEIVTSAERMQALNEGLVTWVRARNSALEFTDVSLEAVVRECLEAFESRIAGLGALVTVSALPVVCADATAVGVVLHHLVDNALRYTDAGRIPTIHIGATRSGHNVTIVVRDNGIGIDLANRERVFGVFTRIDPGRDPGRPGVGLTISRTIVERLGGRLWIDAATGGGTDAAFTLPTTTTPMSTRQASVLPDVERHDASALEPPVQHPEALAAIVEFSGDAILSKDLDGRIRTWNRAAETLYGFPANEAIGQHASILMPPERMQELQAQIDTIRTGRCIHLETVRLRKNGDRIDVSLTISPIRDASGTVVGASVIARDATEQHQTEEQLRAFLEVAPDAIVVIEHTGVINAVNSQAEATFGYTADAMVGRPLEMLIPGRFRSQHLAQMLAFTASPNLRPMGSGLELCGLRCDGTEFPADIQLSTIPTRKGLLPVAAIRDITERRRLERLRDDFIGNAAHELRTPLTTLAGLGETLAKNYDVMARDDIEQAFTAMARQGDRARVLIYNLLDLSNIEGGRADFTVSEVEIGLLVDRALESTPPPAGKTVTSTVPRDLIVRFDPGRLEQIVTNLLVNAYRYGGTTIRIDAAPQKENNVMLSVLDDGAGVAPDFVSELFEPFTRGKQPNAVRGSGIGLALCRRIVRSMKGDIWYETLSPRGAAFRISLPGPS